MKRKLKWLAIVLAVLLLGFGTALFFWPRDRITAESWQNIRIGMTEEEVVEILGGPGMSREEYWPQIGRLDKELGRVAFEFGGPIVGPILEERADFLADGRALPIDWDKFKIWNGRRGMIQIELNQDNLVCWKRFDGRRRINAGILDRLRDWLGW